MSIPVKTYFKYDVSMHKAEFAAKHFTPLREPNVSIVWSQEQSVL